MSADSTDKILLYIKVGCGPAKKLSCENARIGYRVSKACLMGYRNQLNSGGKYAKGLKYFVFVESSIICCFAVSSRSA